MVAMPAHISMRSYFPGLFGRGLIEARNLRRPVTCAPRTSPVCLAGASLKLGGRDVVIEQGRASPACLAGASLKQYVVALALVAGQTSPACLAGASLKLHIPPGLPADDRDTSPACLAGASL